MLTILTYCSNEGLSVREPLCFVHLFHELQPIIAKIISAVAIRVLEPSYVRVRATRVVNIKMADLLT